MNKLLLVLLFALTLFTVKAQVGSLDPSYGFDGIQLFKPVFSNDLYVLKVITAPDKSIYVVYGNSNFYEQVVVAKFTVDGSPDLSYGTSGYSETLPMHFADGAIQSDGKIVLTGSTVYDFYPDIHDDIMVVRFTTNGVLDQSFNNYGYVTTTFSGASYEYVQSVTLSNDLIVVKGYSVSLVGQFAGHHVHVYDVSGVLLGRSLIGDFTGLDIFNPGDVKAAVVIQGQKIILATSSYSREGVNFALLRINPDGSPDLSFGKEGTDTIGNAFFDDVSAVGIQGDKIIVASPAFSVSEGLYGIAIGRYNNNGSPDYSFNGTGFQVSYFSSDQYLLPKRMAMQGDKIIVGADNFNLSRERREFALLRYKQNGSLDSSFDGDARQYTGIDGEDFILDKLAVYESHLLVSGWSRVHATGDIYGIAARYLLENNTVVAITCPESKSVYTGKGICNAVVRDIEPVTTAGVAGVRFSMRGATVGNGRGSVSGKRFNKGVTTVTYSLAADPARSCSFTVTVKDREAPRITRAFANPNILWPANNKMRDVTISYTATDNCGDLTTVLSVKSNEVTNRTAAEDISTDWQVIDANHVKLRAKRARKGKDRVYIITIKAIDAAGNKSSHDVTVAVSHNHGSIKHLYADKQPGIMDNTNEGELQVKVLPNPSTTYFTLVTSSSAKEKISIRVLNELGARVETFNQVPPNGVLQLGQSYRSGFYLAEIIQGEKKVVVKLIKM